MTRVIETGRAGGMGRRGDRDAGGLEGGEEVVGGGVRRHGGAEAAGGRDERDRLVGVDGRYLRPTPL